MTQWTHYGYFCFFLDERKFKAPTAASKARPTTFEGGWVFFIRKSKCRNAAGSAGQSTQKCKFCRHFGSVQPKGIHGFVLLSIESGHDCYVKQVAVKPQCGYESVF